MYTQYPLAFHVDTLRKLILNVRFIKIELNNSLIQEEFDVPYNNKERQISWWSLLENKIIAENAIEVLDLLDYAGARMQLSKCSYGLRID